MPVYEITYKSWEGSRLPLIYRLLAFPKYTYLQLKGRKRIHTTFVLSWFPFLLFLIYIYARVNVQLLQSLRFRPQTLPPVDGKFFLTFILTQLPFLFAFTLLVGPPLISTDLKNKAVPMILSKPISRWEYLLGKFMILFLLLSILSWVQGSILFLMNTFAVPSASEWRQNFWSDSILIFFKMIIFALTIIITLNFLVLTFSSLTNTPSFASVAFGMYVIGSIIVAGILSALFNSDKWGYISPMKSVMTIGISFFNENAIRFSSHSIVYAWGSLVILWALCLTILLSRIKAFQIHKE